MLNIPDYFLTILKLINEKKLISIFAIRVLFIYSSILYNGYGYIGQIKNSDDYRCVLGLNLDENEIDLYLEHICLFGLSLLNETFNSKELYDKIVKINDELIINESYTDFKEKYTDQLAQIEIEIYDYYILRDSDSWRDANEQISITNYNNKINLIGETLWEKINLNKWTLNQDQIIIGGNWGKLKGLIDKNILDQIENSFITEYNEVDLVYEHNNILDSSIKYSINELIESEFWLDIVNNFTISGFYNYLLINYFKNNLIDVISQIKIFHILNSSFFQTSIIVWKIKYDIEDPRPLQIIRGSQLSLPLNYYFGESNSDSWLPFINFDIELPSCPDFPSDISAISSTGSFILSLFLSENINNLDIKINLEFLNNKLDNQDNQDNQYNQELNLELLKIPKKYSKIIKNNPLNDIIIKNNTWDDLAKNISNSVVVSGLSTNFSSMNGYKIGIEIGKVIYEYFT